MRAIADRWWRGCSCSTASWRRRPSRFRRRSADPRGSGDRPVLLAASGLFLEFVDLFRGVGLGQVVLELLMRFFAEGLEVAGLRAGHRFFAGDPVVGVLDG